MDHGYVICKFLFEDTVEILGSPNCNQSVCVWKQRKDANIIAILKLSTGCHFFQVLSVKLILSTWLRTYWSPELCMTLRWWMDRRKEGIEKSSKKSKCVYSQQGASSCIFCIKFSASHILCDYTIINYGWWMGCSFFSEVVVCFMLIYGGLHKWHGLVYSR